MMKLSIKKGATVEVITGAEKGKRGTVLDVDKKNLRLRIQGVKIQTKHSKKDGLQKSEGYIHYSNAKLIEAAPAKKSEKKSAKKTKAAKTKSAE
jgi:large subunit ribosomal protein L24